MSSLPDLAQVDSVCIDDKSAFGVNMKMCSKIIFLLVALFAFGCGGPDGEDSKDVLADTAENPQVDVKESGVDVEDPGDFLAEIDSAEEPVLLLCPAPGPLPFTTESEAFTDADLGQVSIDSEFNLDINQDVMGNSGAEQVISGRFMRGNNALLGQVFADEWVSLWTSAADGSWTSLGRALTDEDGAYSIPLSGDDAFEMGSFAVYAIMEGDQSCEPHGIFLWPAGTKIVVTDIDGTLTFGDEELISQMADQSYDQLEMPSASEMMQAWSDKGYKVLYVTARIDLFRPLTRVWLYAHGMPFGPLITTEKLTQGEATREYKATALNRIQDEFGWELVAAYGNAITDVQAFGDAGIPKDATFSIGEAMGELETVGIPDSDYADHLLNYVANQPAADQPF
jgi:LNS2 (Lipin/Ned1/Smp2)